MDIGLVDLPFFFFNDTATTEIYTLSLHDALPICDGDGWRIAITGGSAHEADGIVLALPVFAAGRLLEGVGVTQDRKSTRLNSSHSQISYAVFCLKKKKINTT